MYSAEHKTSSHIIIINIPLIIILLYWVGLYIYCACNVMVLSKCFFHSLIYIIYTYVIIHNNM